MAATDRTAVLATATFSTTTFILFVVTGLHLHGTLSDSLQRSNTMVGAVAFFILWGTTWFSTRYGMGRVRSREEASAVDVFGWTIVAGGLNGVLLWWVIALVLLIVGPAGVGRSLGAAFGLLLVVLPVGSVFAFAIGAVVGSLYGVLNGAVTGVSSVTWTLMFGSQADESMTRSAPAGSGDPAERGQPSQ